MIKNYRIINFSKKFFIFFIVAIIFSENVHSLNQSSCSRLSKKKASGTIFFFPSCKRLYSRKTGASYIRYKHPGFRQIKKSFGEWQLTVSAKSFQPGNLYYFEFTKKEKKKDNLSPARIVYLLNEEKKSISFEKREWGYRALAGIPPDYKKSRFKIKILLYKINPDGSKREITHDIFLALKPRRDRLLRQALNLGKYSDSEYVRKRPELRARINREWQKRKATYQIRSLPSLDHTLSHPRSIHRITSPFYLKRKYLRYRWQGKRKIYENSRIAPHLGLDFWGTVGSPVYAIAGGRVVLAEKMYYPGNIIILDHGNGLFSEYMHLHKILVKAGDLVSGGTLIAQVGKSGMVTAAHLHLGLRFQDEYLDPESLYILPLR